MKQYSNQVILTEKLLREGMKSGCGIKMEQADLLGIEYPPKSGWFSGLIGTSMSEETYQKFLELRDGAPILFGRGKRKKRRNKMIRDERNTILKRLGTP